MTFEIGHRGAQDDRPGRRRARGWAAARSASLGLAGLILLGTAGLSPAQTWQSRINDSGALMSASAFAPGNTLRFSCTAPSPSGRPLVETGDHEAHRTDAPFTMIVAVGDGLLDPYGDSSDLAAPRASLDATTFGLPPMIWDEFFWSWHTTLGMGDQMFAAARGAGELVFDTGRGTAFSFPTDGLDAALVRAMSYCITGWQLAGQGVPEGLRPILLAAGGQSADAPPQGANAPAAAAPDAYAPVRSSNLPAGYRLAPLSPLPSPPISQVDAHLTALCQGAWSSDPNYVQAADLDGDGREDLVLNWSGVECRGAITGRTFCGAANCRIDVFVSARGYADPVEFLGIAADVVLDGQGRTGLLLSGTGFLCADGFCDTPFYWTGTDFSQ